jgi:hypothetical protein
MERRRSQARRRKGSARERSAHTMNNARSGMRR